MKRDGAVSFLRLVLGRRQRAHRQRMDLCPHAITQRGVDELVARHARLALERGTDDQRIEVPAIARDLEHAALQAGSDVAPHIVGRRFQQFLSL